MVKGRRKRTPAQSSIHPRSNMISQGDGLFPSPLNKEIKLESEHNNKKEDEKIEIVEIIGVTGIGCHGAKIGRVKKLPPRITSYFTSPRVNHDNKNESFENTIKKEEPKDNYTTPEKKIFKDDERKTNKNLDDTSPVTERFKTDETPVAVPCCDPPTPHRINMPNIHSDESDTRSSIEKIEKKPLGTSQSIIQPTTGKIPRGRQKIKYTVAPNHSTNGKSNGTSCNHKLTEYFPVRRSERKCKKTVLEEKQRDIENKVLCQVEDGLEIKHFVGKGRGIVTTREFLKGEYVIEYVGELIDQVTAKKRETEYAKDQNTGCYMYYFQHRGQQYCVDATAESEKLGRLVNHSRNGNLVARVIEIVSIPHLVLTAKEDIPIGVEIAYDYGDRSRESIRNHPWLAL